MSSGIGVSTGNAGIGTTTPWGQLSVNSNGNTGPAFVIGSSTGTSFIVSNDGKIGIGTPSPSTNLDGTYGISLEGNGGATSYTETTYRNNSGAGNITLNHARGTQSVPLALNANDTVGTIYFQAYNLNGTLQTTGAISSLVNDQVSGSDKGSLTFGVNSGTDEVMRIVGGVTGSGVLKNTVGIGTTSPAYTLDVRDNSGSNVQSASSRVLNVGNASTRFDTTTSTPSSYAGFFNSNSFRSAGSNALTNIGIYSTASGAQNNYSAIFDQGNVGIGTTSPAQKLDVNGTIRQTGCLTAGTLSANTAGDIICTPSSLRFKDNIESVGAGLSDIVQLRPVSYHFKPELDMGSSTRYGFIAEEVASVTPAFATYDASGAPYGLDTNAILAAAVNAIKQLDLKVNGGVPTAIATAQSSLQSLAANIGQTASALTSDAFTQIASWLGDAGNGITKIFAGDVESKKSSTENLCVKNATGETCITRDQLDALIAGAPAAAATPTVVPPAELLATSTPPALEAATTTPEATSTPLLPNTGSVARFDRTLDMGSSGTDVTALQTILMQKGFLYLPSGMSPGYFGALTREAVMKYQNSVGLPPLGVVGPLTRAKLNGEL